MNIVICGAGEVGSHAAEALAHAGHSVTVIDTSAEALGAIADSMDVATLQGNGAEAERLIEAGAAGADMLVAATDHDEANLVAASVAKRLGTRKTVARVHRIDYFENEVLSYQQLFGIDHLICPEFATAGAIARTLRNPAALAIEHFAHGQVEMQEFAVTADSGALNKPLSHLRLPIGTRLTTVIRGSQVFIPNADTEILEDDKIVLVGNSDVFYEARELFQREHSGRKKVVIMGGPAMSVWLCRILRHPNWSIRLFETGRDRAVELAENLDWVTVIQADPTDRSVFAEERLGLADVFIAMLDEDEVNIIGCVMAKTMGIPKVMAVVNRATYLDLLYHIGVDHPFSPRRVAVDEIEHILDQSPLRGLATLGDGSVATYRVRVAKGGRAVGQPLREIKLSPNWVIAAINREDRVWVPGAEDTIETGDVVLVVGQAGQEKTLNKLFLSRK